MLTDIVKFIKSELRGVEALPNALDKRTEEAVEALVRCRGRVVFMGVGKSGRIAEKLAATFASLGTPSFFVHSTEAMHGDLGMICAEDTAVLVSNSGNTAETVQNVAPLKKNGVTTVAFTAGAESALARLCDYRILYPKTEEADELNLAPTTSSTVTLVLGDAIACALAKRKDFSRKDFFGYHPNGALGELLKGENDG